MELSRIVKGVAFGKLAESIQRSIKVKDIRYSKLELQPYLKSPCLSEEEMNVLTALRSKCIRGIKTDFKNMYKTCLHCPLQCNTEEPQNDTQEHVLQCKKLKGSDMDMIYIYTEGVQQGEVAKQFSELMKQRTTMLEEEETSSTCCLPGASFLDPSTAHGAPLLFRVEFK